MKKLVLTIAFLAAGIAHADGIISVTGKLVTRPSSAGAELPVVVEQPSGKRFYITTESFKAVAGGQTCLGTGLFTLTPGLNGQSPYKLLSVNCEE